DVGEQERDCALGQRRLTAHGRWLTGRSVYVGAVSSGPRAVCCLRLGFGLKLPEQGGGLRIRRRIQLPVQPLSQFPIHRQRRRIIPRPPPPPPSPPAARSPAAGRLPPPAADTAPLPAARPGSPLPPPVSPAPRDTPARGPVAPAAPTPRCSRPAAGRGTGRSL